MRTLYTLILLTLVTACSHPLEIVGEGDIVSASGDRSCLLANYLASDTACTQNYVVGDYQETYFAAPHTGWQFDHWENYCDDASAPNYDCSFNIDASTVETFYGVTLPPLVAVFTPIAAITESDTVAALGRDWAQPDLFQGVTWSEINSACPAGTCLSGATLNGYDVTGWQWASVNEATALFNAFFGSEILGPGPDAYTGSGAEHFLSVVALRATGGTSAAPIVSALLQDVDSNSGNAYSINIFDDSLTSSADSMRTNIQVPVNFSDAGIGALLYRDTLQIASNTVHVGNNIWAQPDQFIGVTWNDIVSVCPAGLCGPSAIINGVDLNGWTFASVEEVNALFNYFFGSAELGPGQDAHSESGSAWAKAFFMAGFRETGRLLNVVRVVQGATLTDALLGSSFASHGAFEDRIGTTASDAARTDYANPKSSEAYSAWFYRPVADTASPRN